MNNNELIKALECCNSNERGSCLNKCPYYKHSATCTQSMIADTLDLINRQQAEIERLTETLDIYAVEFDLKYASVKAEAIKEFAERLKEKSKNNEWNGTICGADIDNLVKEMKGGAE